MLGNKFSRLYFYFCTFIHPIFFFFFSFLSLIWISFLFFATHTHTHTLSEHLSAMHCVLFVVPFLSFSLSFSHSVRLTWQHQQNSTKSHKSMLHALFLPHSIYGSLARRNHIKYIAMNRIKMAKWWVRWRWWFSVHIYFIAVGSKFWLCLLACFLSFHSVLVVDQ